MVMERGRQLTPKEVADIFGELRAERIAHERGPDGAHLAALKRLWDIGRRDTGQASVVANFLLGLYNGSRFTFDLTSLRRLDRPIFDDCLSVLQLDNNPKNEVHDHLGIPSHSFESQLGAIPHKV